VSVPSVSVVVPTRNRPRKLENCLDALAAARQRSDFDVYVVDSSTEPELVEGVEEVCARFPFAELARHSGNGVAAARNECARVAGGDLLVNVDDDVYVEADAIERLLDGYRSGSGWRAVAGSVWWGSYWSRPVVMRRIGYGRAWQEGEDPDFLVGAFFLYPRALALACPWIESVRTSDDRIMGALWKGKGVSMLYAPDARAVHDEQTTVYPEDSYADHIYGNLFEALVADRSALRALSYEVLGLAACAWECVRERRSLVKLARAWGRGHVWFARDLRQLRSAAGSLLPAPPRSADAVAPASHGGS
jgi:glycosyltransferase involved in cell wall biosynthesis